MTIKDLKKLIDKLPDNMPVLVPSHDHSYRGRLYGFATTAMRDEFGDWTEDHGPEYTSEEDYGKRTKVFVIE